MACSPPAMLLQVVLHQPYHNDTAHAHRAYPAGVECKRRARCSKRRKDKSADDMGLLALRRYVCPPRREEKRTPMLCPDTAQNKHTERTALLLLLLWNSSLRWIRQRLPQTANARWTDHHFPRPTDEPEAPHIVVRGGNLISTPVPNKVGDHVRRTRGEPLCAVPHRNSEQPPGAHGRA